MMISASDKKTLELCLEHRGKMSQGINLLKGFLHDQSSKLAVSLGSFLGKRILELSRENGAHLKKIVFDKENKEKNAELKKLVTILTEERIKIEEKLLPLEL